MDRTLPMSNDPKMAGPTGWCKSAVASAGVALILCSSLEGARAQDRLPPRIWDVEFGTHVSNLPLTEFVDPACGTNGGPPGLLIGGFDQFARCPEEATGLREIWFVYDDLLEYIARARRDAGMVGRLRATQVLQQPVLLSFLLDRDGLVQGYRIFTDWRAEPALRVNAYTLAFAFKARYGLDGWTCTDLPRAEGENPIGRNPFIKEQCEKVSEGRRMIVETRLYYKPGQAALDPRDLTPMVNAFESSARLEVYRLGAVRQ